MNILSQSEELALAKATIGELCDTINQMHKDYALLLEEYQVKQDQYTSAMEIIKGREAQVHNLRKQLYKALRGE